MSASYLCRIADPRGQPLATVANFATSGSGPALEYALSAGQVGALRLTLPSTFDDRLLQLDGRIGVWRSVAGRPAALDGQAIFVIRTWEYTDDTVTVTAYHANSLLQRRIIAYGAGSAQTTKSGAAGNVIKAFVRENLTGTTAGRDSTALGTNLSAYLGVAADDSAGASLSQAATRRSLFTVIRDVCDASSTAGTYLTAEIVAPTEGTLELRTYAGQRGVDHRVGSAQPVILSRARGNLSNVVLTIDRRDEATVVIAGGKGEQDQRVIAVASDAARIGDSPWGVIEQFVEDSNVGDLPTLQARAQAALRAAAPRITLVADLVETAGTTRGIHFDLGDLVTVEHRGKQYDARLDVISVSLGADGVQEKIQIRSTGGTPA